MDDMDMFLIFFEFVNFFQFLSNILFFSNKSIFLRQNRGSNLRLSGLQSYAFSNWAMKAYKQSLFISDHILKHKRRKWKNWFFNFSRRGTPMILVSFFSSHRALSIGISRDGIGLKVTEIAQTDRHTHTHSAFNIFK